MARAQPIEIDIRNHRKDGKPFWNRLLMAPVHDGTGTLTYFFASQVDVTLERERLEGLESDNASLMAELTSRLHEQQEREREMAFAMKAGRFGTWSIDLKKRELTASETCRTLFGFGPTEPFTYEQRVAAIHPQDRAATLAALEGAIDSHTDYDTSYRVPLPNRAIRWIASRGQAFYGPERQPLRMAGVSIDITAERRAEGLRAALLDLGDAFRDLDSSADISFAAAEVIGRTLGVSRVGYGVIDRGSKTISIERDWNDDGITTIAALLHFRDYGSYIEELKRGETVVVEDARLDPRTTDNASNLEGISARAFVNMPLTEQGGLVAIIYLNHADVRAWPEDELHFIREIAERTRVATERRRVETELATLAASLEQQVAERTAALLATEEALRQSQKMEAVGQLTGGLAHDFNNLLTGISGSLELIKSRFEQGRTDGIARYIDAAQGAGRRAAALTHRLLAFSRRQTLAPKPIDVRRLIAGMEELVRRTVGPSIDVEVVHASGLWTTKADPGQLENALLNLWINARDAMPDGGRLTIETQNRSIDRRVARERDIEPGQYVSLCVSDSGTGMTPDVIEKAFDPFFTTKPIGLGTGLGLSMIYGFARQSGGHARIYSEIGQGTMVCIYLPRHLGEAEAEERAPEEAEVPRAAAGETVLLIDDEPTVRMLIGEILQELGYTSLVASDGASGLKIINSGVRIDLLITDVGLPGGMNGRQVADAAREVRPDLQILFITGFAENAVLSHGHLDHGMHVLTKPFTMQGVARRIRELICAGRKPG